MRLTVIAAVFPVIFLGELPDKTMFTTLFLASRGRPVAVWCGTAFSFAVHVVIAVAIGAGIFALVPHRAVDAVVAGLFLAGAVYSYLIRNQEEHTGELHADAGWWTVAGRAAVLIFIAEWGDLTQILTANLAARFHQPVSVGIGAVAGLWAVAAVAGFGGARLTRFLSVRTLRTATAVVLVVLAGISAFQAARAA